MKARTISMFNGILSMSFGAILFIQDPNFPSMPAADSDIIGLALIYMAFGFLIWHNAYGPIFVLDNLEKR